MEPTRGTLLYTLKFWPKAQRLSSFKRAFWGITLDKNTEEGSGEGLSRKIFCLVADKSHKWKESLVRWPLFKEKKFPKFSLSLNEISKLLLRKSKQENSL